MNTKFMLWLKDVDLFDKTSMSKTTELLAKLTQAQFPVIPGFIITPFAYTTFLKENYFDEKVKRLLATTAVTRPDSLMQTASHIKQLFIEARMPEEIETELHNFYRTLTDKNVKLTLFENEPHGRKHISLVAKNESELLIQIKKAWAEMFSGSALWHRYHLGYNLTQTSCEILVQKHIPSEISGSVVTVDPNTHAKEVMIITTHTPHITDQYYISKKNGTIIDRKLKHLDNLAKLTTEEILAITKMSKRLEEHLYYPQELSWVLHENKLYLKDTKPFSALITPQEEKKRRIPVARGIGLTHTIGTGPIKIVSSLADFQKVTPQNVVVLPHITNKHLKHLSRVRSIIVEGGIDKETENNLKRMGIPVIVIVTNATKHFRTGSVITVHAGLGEIYKGGFI